MTSKEVIRRRKKLGISREEMASALGVSFTTICRWETEGRGLRQGTAAYAINKYFQEKEKNKTWHY